MLLAARINPGCCFCTMINKVNLWPVCSLPFFPLRWQRPSPGSVVLTAGRSLFPQTLISGLSFVAHSLFWIFLLMGLLFIRQFSGQSNKVTSRIPWDNCGWNAVRKGGFLLRLEEIKFSCELPSSKSYLQINYMLKRICTTPRNPWSLVQDKSFWSNIWIVIYRISATSLQN